jgi:hypothetical protein
MLTALVFPLPEQPIVVPLRCLPLINLVRWWKDLPVARADAV